MEDRDVVVPDVADTLLEVVLVLHLLILRPFQFKRHHWSKALKILCQVLSSHFLLPGNVRPLVKSLVWVLSDLHLMLPILLGFVQPVLRNLPVETLLDLLILLPLLLWIVHQFDFDFRPVLRDLFVEVAEPKDNTNLVRDELVAPQVSLLQVIASLLVQSTEHWRVHLFIGYLLNVALLVLVHRLLLLNRSHLSGDPLSTLSSLFHLLLFLFLSFESLFLNQEEVVV